MPVSQPPNYLSWDTNNVNILTPPSSFLQNGYVPGEAPPAEYDNYALQLLDLWIQWLQQQQAAGGGLISVTTSQTVVTTYASYFAAPVLSNINLTLPSANGVSGQIWRLKNTAFGTTNTVTILLANASDKLEGTTNGTLVLNPGEIFNCQSDGKSPGNFFEISP